VATGDEKLGLREESTLGSLGSAHVTVPLGEVDKGLAAQGRWLAAGESWGGNGW